MALKRTFSEEDADLTSALVSSRIHKSSDINLLFKSRKINSSDSNEARGDIYKVLDAAAVKQSVKNIVMTNFGEKPFNVQFGGDVVGYLFETVDEITEQDIKINVQQAIEIYEPRAEVLDIFCGVYPEQNCINLTIKFRVVNSEEIVVLETQIARLR